MLTYQNRQHNTESLGLNMTFRKFNKGVEYLLMIFGVEDDLFIYLFIETYLYRVDIISSQAI